MQELNMVEVNEVNGGVIWIPIVIIVIGLSGCDDSPAVDKENKNKKKIDDAIEKSGG